MKRKRTKKTYRIRNWREYNKALVQRGSLTIWFSEEVTEDWINKGKTKKKGIPLVVNSSGVDERSNEIVSVYVSGNLEGKIEFEGDKEGRLGGFFQEEDDIF